METAQIENLDFFDYRTALKSELKKRSEKNDRYSLRAFARDLGMSPSYLCEVLGGKASLSPRRIERVAPLLELSEDELEAYKASSIVQNPHMPHEIRHEALNSLMKFSQVSQ